LAFVSHRIASHFAQPSESTSARVTALAMVAMMVGMADDVDQRRKAVENMHGGTATLAQSVPGRETFGGKPE
jgi:hypothetical protein